jgi:hypothetical protein
MSSSRAEKHYIQPVTCRAGSALNHTPAQRISSCTLAYHLPTAGVRPRCPTARVRCLTMFKRNGERCPACEDIATSYSADDDSLSI